MKDKNEIFGLVFFLFIALAAIGGGIYQLYKGYVKVGYNSRGGVGVNYGGTAIFMGLLLLWMAYLEWKRTQDQIVFSALISWSTSSLIL